MLTKITNHSGVVTYRSELLGEIGVPHGFATRMGGVSPQPFESLNFGNPQDCQAPDSQENIDENFARLQKALGLSKARRAWVKQVHSDRVEVVEYMAHLAATREDFLREHFAGQRQADGLITQEPETMLTIRVADCVPVLFSDASGKLVAAAHAGWRGVVSGVCRRTIRTMSEMDANIAEIRVAIGPCISAEHFEIGPEVAEAFSRAGLEEAIVDRNPNWSKPHIDLVKALVIQLSAMGVKKIDTTDRCTVRDASEFYSHRRDNGLTGRMVAVIAPGR